MTGKEIIKAAASELVPFVGEHGYVDKRLAGRFIKSSATLDKRITLLAIRWSNGSGYRLDHYCEFRLPAHTDLLNRYLPLRTEREKKTAPTIAQPSYQLLPPGFDLQDITIAHESDIARVVRNIKHICDHYSLPFLDRFATAEDVIQGFRRGRETWAVQDPMLQFELLLLDGVLKNDTAGFNRWYIKALGSCGGRTDGAAVNLMNLARSLKKDYFSEARSPDK